MAVGIERLDLMKPSNRQLPTTNNIHLSPRLGTRDSRHERTFMLDEASTVRRGHTVRVPWFYRRLRSQLSDVEQSPVVRGPHDDPSLSDEELTAQRTRWFETYTTQKNVFADEAGGPYSCPACGHVTLGERGGYEMCGECGWEDDGQDDHDADVVRGGPNGVESLADARAAYVKKGGILLPHRSPSDPV